MTISKSVTPKEYTSARKINRAKINELFERHVRPGAQSAARSGKAGVWWRNRLRLLPTLDKVLRRWHENGPGQSKVRHFQDIRLRDQTVRRLNIAMNENTVFVCVRHSIAELYGKLKNKLKIFVQLTRADYWSKLRPSFSKPELLLQGAVDRINWRFQSSGWKPIVSLKRHFSDREIQHYYKAADLCMVTALQDGMNLVAKEFIAARQDEQGVLILSRFTGAARELLDSVLVNPYDVESTADAISHALKCPPRSVQPACRGSGKR